MMAIETAGSGPIVDLTRHIVDAVNRTNKVGALSDDERLHVMASLLQLRRENRAIHMRNKEARECVMKQCEDLGRSDVVLRNIRYEQLSLRREIQRIKDGRNMFQDVGLLSEEEFAVLAPPDLSQVADPHKRMLNRLSFELTHRSSLMSHKTELLRRKLALIDENGALEQQLNKLPEYLNAVSETSKPLQEMLGQSEETLLDNERSRFLALPLYNLYCLVSLHSDPRISRTEIMGSLEQPAGGSPITLPAASNPATDLPIDNASAMDEDVDIHVGSGMELDYEEVQVKSRRTSGLSEPDRSNLYEHWPISLRVTLHTGSDSERREHAVQLDFRYFPKLDIVGLHATSTSTVLPENWLRYLFAGDDGLQSPKAPLYLQDGTQFDVDAAAHYYPYGWVQRLCGLNFPQAPSIGDVCVISPSFKQVLNALAARAEAIVWLRTSLALLADTTLPEVKNPTGEAWPSFRTTLTEWQLLNTSDDIGTYPVQLEYRAVFKTGSNVFWRFRVTIHCTYPEKTPVFEVCDVTPHANISIVSMKAVENQVMHHVMLDPQQCISILAYQLMKLLKALDALPT